MFRKLKGSRPAHRTDANGPSTVNDTNGTRPSVTHTNGTRDSAELLKASDNATADDAKLRYISPRVVLMGVIVSIGGMIFGYDTGQFKDLKYSYPRELLPMLPAHRNWLIRGGQACAVANGGEVCRSDFWDTGNAQLHYAVW